MLSKSILEFSLSLSSVKQSITKYFSITFWGVMTFRFEAYRQKDLYIFGAGKGDKDPNLSQQKSHFREILGFPQEIYF